MEVNAPKHLSHRIYEERRIKEISSANDGKKETKINKGNDRERERERERDHFL